MTDPSDPRTHLPVLDGLRGLAAIVVVVSHCANAGLLPAALGQGLGQIGVGLFYALSGLLMGRLYLHRPLDRAGLAEYAIRRGARVLPLYYAALALGVAMLVAGLSPYRLDGAGDVLRAAALVQGTGVLWSIPVEIQFYVVFAGIWACARRGRLMVALAVLLAVQAVAAVAILATIGLGPGLSHTYNLAFWLHLFLFGTLLGALSTRPRAMALHGARGPAVTAGVAAFLALSVLVPPGVRAELGLPRVPAFADPVGMGYPMLLLVAGLLGLGPMRLFAARPLRWLGRVSFSVYLLHMPVLAVVVTALSGWPAALQAALVVAATLGLSALTERGIETGAQRAILRRGLARRAPAAGAGHA